MEQDPDQKVSDSVLAPSNSDAAETTLAQNLPVAPSSSSAGSNVSQLICTSASLPLDPNVPVAPSISTDSFNLLSGTATTLPLLGPSSSSAGSNVSQSCCTTASLSVDPNLSLAPSSSTGGVDLLSGLSSSTNTALPLGPSSSTDGLDLLSGLSSSTNTALPHGPSSSTDGLDLSLGFSQALTAAGSPSLSTDLSLGQPGSQVASSSRNNAKPPTTAINFAMTKITIGTWTQVAVNSRSLLVARCYFGKQQFVWDIHDVVQTETGTKQEWKRMEIQWGDVLSLKADVVTGCLEIELRRPPSFFIKESGVDDSYRWKQINHFTQAHPSTFCRRHELYFDPDVLKTNYNKIVAHSFWATGGILEVPFPTLPHSPYFTNELAAHQLLGPQGIPPAQPVNVPSPEPQVGPDLGGTSEQNPQAEASKTGDKRKRQDHNEYHNE